MSIGDAIHSEFRLISESDSVSGKELHALAAKFASAFVSDLDPSMPVAIHCAPLNTARLVAALDGVAQSVLIAPADACKNFIRHVESKLNIGTVINDGLVDASHWNAPVRFLQEFSTKASGPADVEFATTANTTWLLSTSGTTGTPKIVSHTIASLTRTAARRGQIPGGIWGLLYDPARFAGLQVVLQAMLSAEALLAPSPMLDFDQRIAFLAENRCTAISATPSLWRKILMTRSAEALNLGQVTLGCEIADQNILNALSAKFPKANICHIYASTEAGVGFSVKDGRAGFPASWLSAGIRGVELKISPSGTLCLRNTVRGQAYVGETIEISGTDGWMDTGDLLRVDGDRAYFAGRLNGSINVGGNKVIPEEIESQVLQVPGVFQVTVVGKPSSITGTLIEAHIVPDASVHDEAELITRVRRHCRSNMPAFKVPAFIKIVRDISVGSSGKASRA